ncbi:hypothetical protein OQA88_7342 [Cercophora sp. LCS_1]
MIRLTTTTHLGYIPPTEATRSCHGVLPTRPPRRLRASVRDKDSSTLDIDEEERTIPLARQVTSRSVGAFTTKIRFGTKDALTEGAAGRGAETGNIWTMIAPPLSQYPKSWREFLKFAYEVVTTVGRGKLSAFAISFSSKPSFFKPARFKLNNANVALTAKAFHRDLAQALAEGNKNAVNNMCVKAMSIPLLAAITARPKDRRFSWELVKYNKSPKLKSHVMAPVSKDKGAPFIRQVVVSISSKQKKTEYRRSANGKWAQHGVKEVDVDENVCMVALVNPVTWTQGEWRLIGYPKNSTPEEWELEKKDMEKMQELEMMSK